MGSFRKNTRFGYRKISDISKDSKMTVSPLFKRQIKSKLKK